MNRSITVRKKTVEFIEKWLKDHAAERLREGKALTIVSIFREGLVLWAEEHGMLDELVKVLKESK